MSPSFSAKQVKKFESPPKIKSPGPPNGLELFFGRNQLHIFSQNLFLAPYGEYLGFTQCRLEVELEQGCWCLEMELVLVLELEQVY